MFTARHFLFFYVFKNICASKEDSYACIIFVKLFQFGLSEKIVKQFSQFFNFRKQCIYSTNGSATSLSSHLRQFEN